MALPITFLFSATFASFYASAACTNSLILVIILYTSIQIICNNVANYFIIWQQKLLKTSTDLNKQFTIGRTFSTDLFFNAVVGMAKPTNNINFKYQKWLVKRTPTTAKKIATRSALKVRPDVLKLLQFNNVSL
jgi:hypothetical protein